LYKIIQTTIVSISLFLLISVITRIKRLKNNSPTTTNVYKNRESMEKEKGIRKGGDRK